uniref:hypothetical protein n=1 Tax=Sulfurospirillum cavolei TaxID=366522 RepID=UPI003FA226DE
MAQVLNLGTIGFVYKGDYSGGAYKPQQVVKYNGGVHVSKKAVPAGILPTDADYWDVWLYKNAIEQTTIPVIGLMWNQTDDMYKRIGKNVNYASIDGTGEFTSWK